MGSSCRLVLKRLTPKRPLRMESVPTTIPTVSILKRTALAFGYLNRAANGKNKNEKRDGDNDADE